MLTSQTETTKLDLDFENRTLKVWSEPQWREQTAKAAKWWNETLKREQFAIEWHDSAQADVTIQTATREQAKENYPDSMARIGMIAWTRQIWNRDGRIYVNPDCIAPPSDYTFTLAHEIGHTLGYIHRDVDGFLMAPEESNGWKIDEADHAVAKILRQWSETRNPDDPKLIQPIEVLKRGIDMGVAIPVWQFEP